MTETATADSSYMQWGAIIAGSILMLAFSFLLISFGASLGLSLTSPYRGEGVSAAWLAVAAGIWFAWVMVSGFGAGGYLAGRMRRHAGDGTPHEVALRDGAHGLVVWATAALTSTLIAATGVGGVLGAGAAVVGTATEVTSQAASSDYFANVLLRSGVQAPQTGTNDTAPMADGGAPALPAGQQAAPSGQGGQATLQQEVAGILARSATEGELAGRDRLYLAQLIAANSDLDQDAALARIDDITAEIDAARQTAMDAVEQARVAGVVFGFIAAATLLIGAIAAVFAAVAGGKHRDDGLDLTALTLRR
ncbi:MAG: hypothetical protein IKG52_07630 [Rhodobacteraceae bacterium]|nr:hypothetical protein [Paracoccaceae bacterium]